ncbi:hypothetical protein GW916_03355 [bacterium]|nr:hypothetical protein [bacterium]
MKITAKKSILSLLALISFSASASDVAVVWGTPNFDLEFIQNTVVEHVNVHPGSLETRHSTDVAMRLVRSGAKTISSIGVTRPNGSATAEDFALGLRWAAIRSKVVLSTVGPINGFAICDVIREFENETVFVYPAKRGDVYCGSNNTLQVFNDGFAYPGAHTAADLSNFSTLHPSLSGSDLLRAYRGGRTLSVEKNEAIKN